MAKCFEPAALGSLNLKNRFVRSATWEGLAHDDGLCSAELVALTRELAHGEIGLIISSHAYVSREGQAGPGQAAQDPQGVNGQDAPRPEAPAATGAAPQGEVVIDDLKRKLDELQNQLAILSKKS